VPGTDDACAAATATLHELTAQAKEQAEAKQQQEDSIIEGIYPGFRYKHTLEVVKLILLLPVVDVQL
jgi:hypothetical protein